jgi:hypothetical protein
MPEAIYRREGDVYAPTPWAGSPWSRELQHGGPVCGLFAMAAEAAARETGLAVARLTVDLCRPTPFEPLRLAWRFARRGRRLALVDTSLRRGEEEITRGSALLLAKREGAPNGWLPDEPPPPGPEGLEPTPFMPREYAAQVPPGFHRGVEARMCEDELGPAVWVTTPLELVAGAATSPLVRAAMLSDLTFAIAGRMLLRRRELRPDPRRLAMINADVTLYLERPPEGAWLAFRRASVSERCGIGLAETVQLDPRGRYGRSLQALLANGDVRQVVE